MAHRFRRLHAAARQISPIGEEAITSWRADVALLCSLLFVQLIEPVGDTIGVSNGANMSSPRLCAEFEALVGQEVTAPIISTGGGSCDDFQFVHRHEVYGFATFRINSVECRGQSQEIAIEFLCNQGGADDNAVGGCANFGTLAPQTRLVR